MKNSKIYSKWGQLPQGEVEGDVQAGCLVIEGGAFRGLYNQGVLDALLEEGINIQTVVGVSAGAMSGVCYSAGYLGRAARINLRYRHDSRYIGIRAWLKSRSILNIDFALREHAQMTNYPFDTARLTRNGRRFIAVATNCQNGETEYYDIDNCSDILTAVKASASMPYLSPMIEVDGTPCLDGGCSCKIAYKWALEQNFEKIVIIRTNHRDYRRSIKDTHRAQKWYRQYPAFAKKLDQSNMEYNLACDEIDQLEKSGRVFVIAPTKPVTVGRLEKDIEKLGALYQEGYDEAKACSKELKAYLGI